MLFLFLSLALKCSPRESNVEIHNYTRTPFFCLFANLQKSLSITNRTEAKKISHVFLPTEHNEILFFLLLFPFLLSKMRRFYFYWSNQTTSGSKMKQKRLQWFSRHSMTSIAAVDSCGSARWDRLQPSIHLLTTAKSSTTLSRSLPLCFIMKTHYVRIRTLPSPIW